ncbi:hypothetical protein THAOC_21301, partial [Thalassiosira oceanica]
EIEIGLAIDREVRCRRQIDIFLLGFRLLEKKPREVQETNWHLPSELSASRENTFTLTHGR